MQMDIKLSDDQIRDLVGEAILAQLEEKDRLLLIKEAMKYLLTPKQDSYSRKTESPLQAAFKSGVEKYAHQAVREWLETDKERQREFRDVFIEAWEKFITGYKDKLTDKIADAMIEGLTKREY